MGSPIKELFESIKDLGKLLKSTEDLVINLSKGKMPCDQFKFELDAMIESVNGFARDLSTEKLLQLKREIYLKALTDVNKIIDKLQTEEYLALSKYLEIKFNAVGSAAKPSANLSQSIYT